MTTALRRGITALVVLLAVALAGYWYAAPLLTLRAMQTAAARGDAAAFSRHVDYPRLRASLKGELAQQATARWGGGQNLAGAAVGALLGLGVVDRLVDALVQPEIVMRVMQEGRMLPPLDPRGEPQDRAAGPAGPASTASSDETLHWRQERQGTDRYIAQAWRGRGERRVTLVLERRGFADWQLVEIRLPPP
ncbi:MAG: DUF2939 domain-containing protein [Proteobacteria bacterium]|nr:DUF2939 domain-containing protein [Pseudomonadota bacterium]